MTLKELRQAIEKPIFWTRQLDKLFPEEGRDQINVQLARWEKREEIIRLKRGVYKFANRQVDELVAATILYQPSYISLETALHLLGIIPEVTGEITSVTTITPREYQNPLGTYSYSKLKKDLYFGFRKEEDEASGMYYQIAEPEKALLDWVYLRNIKGLRGARVDRKKLEEEKLNDWMQQYPRWVQDVVKKGGASE